MKVWGLHGSTGLFAHTEAPVMHRITSKVESVTFVFLFQIPGECDRFSWKQQPGLPRQDIFDLRSHEQPGHRHPSIYGGCQCTCERGGGKSFSGDSLCPAKGGINENFFADLIHFYPQSFE